MTPSLHHGPLSSDPFEWFGLWFSEAKQTPDLPEPNACAVATVSESGQPSVRIVLLKEWDMQGFVFYTNLTSRKGQQALHHPKGAMTFFWPTLQRQIRLEGALHQVSDDQADAYFATRDRGSQLGAWASNQSSPLKDRATLLAQVAHYTEHFKGQPVPRPPHWSGLRLWPNFIEFWHDGQDRLHDRFAFTRAAPDQEWSLTRLYP